MIIKRRNKKKVISTKMIHVFEYVNFPNATAVEDLMKVRHLHLNGTSVNAGTECGVTQSRIPKALSVLL